MTGAQDPEAVLELAQSEEFQELVDTDEISMADLIDLVEGSDIDDDFGHVCGWRAFLFITPVGETSDPAPYTPIAGVSGDAAAEERLQALAEQRSREDD
ncbi:MAG: hypothetical protein ABEI27_03475 [Halobellus sp.]|uniref:hypothetical protein n=1 Tax=Halobellus sp. TaxID=1979212 RepID=UPI0035D43BE5